MVCRGSLTQTPRRIQNVNPPEGCIIYTIGVLEPTVGGIYLLDPPRGSGYLKDELHRKLDLLALDRMSSQSRHCCSGRFLIRPPRAPLSLSISLSLYIYISLSLSMYIYIYMYMYMHIYITIYLFIYIYMYICMYSNDTGSYSGRCCPQSEPTCWFSVAIRGESRDRGLFLRCN